MPKGKKLVPDDTKKDSPELEPSISTNSAYVGTELNEDAFCSLLARIALRNILKDAGIDPERYKC